MRIVKNEKRIKSRGRLARLLLPVGLAALITGFVLSLNQDNPNAQIGAWVALIIGVVCSSIGVYLADKWVSLPLRPRADETLAEGLKSLDVKHKLYSFAVPGLDQILLSPAGLTVFLVKKQDGAIECKNGKWKNKISIFQWLGSFSRERLGNPPKELAALQARASQIAASASPSADVAVDGLIVLSNPKTKIEIHDCGDNIALPDELRAKFRDLTANARRISDATYRELEVALDGLAGAEVVETGTARPVKAGSASPTSRAAGRSRFTRPSRLKSKTGGGSGGQKPG